MHHVYRKQRQHVLPEKNSNDTDPPSCGYWDVFLICHDIVDMVTAPKIKRESLSFLNLLFCEFLTKLKGVFGNVITPKCHYIIHYARLIAMYGPYEGYGACALRQSTNFSRLLRVLAEILSMEQKL